LHIPKIRFVFLVSFTIKPVGIAEFYLYMGFGAGLLKMWSLEPENYRNQNPRTFKIGKLLPVVSQRIAVEATTFLSRMQNLSNIGKKKLWA